MDITTQSSILSEEILNLVKNHLERVGFVTVLHWHLFGGRHPTPVAFHDYEDFVLYIQETARPGDAIDVWEFPQDAKSRLAGGKVPNEDGSIHQGGAY